MSCRPATKPRARWQPMAYPAHAATAELFADISSNNSQFDAHKYASAGHLMIAIKATEGTGYANPYWPRWTIDAHTQRLAVTHYHYCRPDQSDPKLEAQRFWDCVRPHFAAKTDRLALDIETDNEADWPAYLAEVDAELHRLSGIDAIGYTYAAAITPQLQLRSGKWWIASYGTSQPSGARRKLANGSLWAWQYTDGHVNPSHGPTAAAGIGHCDMSVLSPAIIALIKRAR